MYKRIATKKHQIAFVAYPDVKASGDCIKANTSKSPHTIVNEKTDKRALTAGIIFFDNLWVGGLD